MYRENSNGVMKPNFEKREYTNHFYGISSDAETAAYLMEMVRATLDTMLGDFKKSETYQTYKGSRTSLTKSFVDGFAGRISRRLYELHEQRLEELERARQARQQDGESEQELDANRAAHLPRAGESTDIVTLKDAKINNDFRAKFGWAVKYRSVRTGGSSWTGRSAGHGAADKVNLSRPVGNGGGHSGQLRITQS